MYCSLKKEKKDSPPQAVAVVLILHRAKLDRPNLALTTLNRNTDMSKEKIVSMSIDHAATCYPDYFGGHQYSFCIYADGNTTYQDLKDGMLDWQNTDHLTYNLFKTDYEWGLYQDAVELLFQDAEQEGTMQDIFDPRLDIPVTEEEQEEYSCYAWFIIEPELEEMEEDESVVSDTTGEDHAI